jgi:hypothetical protein
MQMQDLLSKHSRLSNLCVPIYLDPLFRHLRLQTDPVPRPCRSGHARAQVNADTLEDLARREGVGTSLADLQRGVTHLKKAMRELEFHWDDPAVLEIFCAARYRDVFNYVSSLLYRDRDGQKAKDYTQEVFLQVCKAMRRYDPRRSQPMTYIKKIAERVVFRLLRKEGKRPTLVPLGDVDLDAVQGPALLLYGDEMPHDPELVTAILRQVVSLLVKDNKRPWQVYAFIRLRMLGHAPSKVLELVRRRTLDSLARELPDIVTDRYLLPAGVLDDVFARWQVQLNRPVGWFLSRKKARDKLFRLAKTRTGSNPFVAYFPGSREVQGRELTEAATSVLRPLVTELLRDPDGPVAEWLDGLGL